VTAADTHGEALRIVTLNLCHGGSGDRVDGLAARLLGYDAEVLVLTEFQHGKSAPLAQRLAAAGYALSYAPGVDPTCNAVAIASRQPITEERPFAAGLDPRHLWCAHTAGIGLCAAYLPVPTELRVPYLEALIADGRARSVGLIIGDFNTGTNPADTTSTPFPRSDLLDALVAAGYTDLWRRAHPEEREYSYYSRKDGKPYNGFRIDRAYAGPELLARLVGCGFDQEPREVGETDHAALSVWIGW
jgi:exodeoxyribonuclease-3